MVWTGKLTCLLSTRRLPKVPGAGLQGAVLFGARTNRDSMQTGADRAAWVMCRHQQHATWGHSAD